MHGIKQDVLNKWNHYKKITILKKQITEGDKIK
jgi:ribosomal protein S18